MKFELFCDLGPRAFPGLLVRGVPPDRGAVATLLARIASFAEHGESLEADRIRPIVVEFIESDEVRAVIGREDTVPVGQLERLQTAFVGFIVYVREALGR